MTQRQQKIRLSDKIYQISTLVAGNFELQEVLDRLAEAAVLVTNTTACSIRLLDNKSGELTMRSTYGLSETYRNKGPVTMDEPVIKQAFTGKAVVLDDMRIDARVRYPEATINEGLISQLTVAITFKGQPLGVLRLYSPEPNRFNRQAIRVARLVATQCAIAITNAILYAQALEGAKMKQQMDLAAVIQRRMIPDKSPCLCGLDLAAVYNPCHEIGGDLYDFFAVDKNSIVVAIADVIGKGVPAAIMMSMFRGAMRAYSDGGYGRHSMQEIVNKLNIVACRECRNGEFITLFLARIDTEQNSITYCNCGHEPGLLIQGVSDIVNLDKGGLVLGLMDNAIHDIETVPFRNEDCLLLYTDGLIDAVNFERQMWGKERLMEVLYQSRGSSASQLIHTILGYRRRFVGLASQIDDTSMLAIRKTNGLQNNNTENTVFIHP
jgi:serine phosphatase RsbU (regulator of sigma subunit)